MDLHSLIKQMVQIEPHHHGGHAWAARSQPWLAEQLGISVATLKRRIKPPIVSIRAKVDGRVTTLLRIAGTTEDAACAQKKISKRHMQNILSRMWRKETGRPLDAKGYGCMAGLADAWGILAPKILTAVLKNWPAFMAGVKVKQAETTGDDAGHNRFYKFPSARVLLRFNEVGADLYVMGNLSQP